MQRIKIDHLQGIGIWTWQMIKMEGLQTRALSSRVTLLARLGLQSHPQLDIFAKFVPSFAKLPKLQTPNAKPLDTSFGAFCQITQMQTSYFKSCKKLSWHQCQVTSNLNL